MAERERDIVADPRQAIADAKKKKTRAAVESVAALRYSLN